MAGEEVRVPSYKCPICQKTYGDVESRNDCWKEHGSKDKDQTWLGNNKRNPRK